MGVKISQLTAALVATKDDLIEVVQDGVSLRITGAMLQDLCIPAGVVQEFAGAVVPDGWFLCDGTSKLKSSYARLYAAIGDSFGSDTTTFKVPDLRGQFVRGYDDGRGVDTGRVFGSTQTGAVESHTHVETGASGGGGTLTNFQVVNNTGNTIVPFVNRTQATGGTETRPTNVALNYIIKY